MKPLFLAAALAVAVVSAGCATRYTITLNNGNRITAQGKPRLEGANYVFKDAAGQKTFVPAGRVREISPARQASSRMNSGFSAKPEP